MDLQRLIGGKPYWEKISAELEDGNKTLIFADWTAWASNISRKESIQHLLAQLLAQKFEIYLWQNNRFVAITSADTLVFGLKGNLKEVMPELPDYIKEIAVEHFKKPIDQFHILDDYEINMLLPDPEKPIQRSIEPRALFPTDPDEGYFFLHEIKKIKHYLAHTHPPISALEMTCMNESTVLSNSLRNFFDEYYPELRETPKKTKLIEIKLRNSSSFKKLVETNALPGQPYSLQQFAKMREVIRKIDIQLEKALSSADVPALKTMVSQMSHLRHLVVGGSSAQDLIDLFLMQNIQSLEITQLRDHAHLDFSKLNHLEDLQIFNAENLTIKVSHDTPVRALTLGAVSLTAECLEQFLHGHFLKKLNMMSVRINGALNATTSYAIEEMYVDEDQNAKLIIKNATGLKKLTLACSIDSLNEAWHLSSLEEFDCSKPITELKQLTKYILKDSRQLKSLHLCLKNAASFNEILDFKQLKDLKFRCLEQSWSGNNCLDSSGVAYFTESLARAVSLERLDMSGIHLELDTPLNLKNLKSLRLADVISQTPNIMDVNLIEKILAGTSHLQELFLRNGKLQGDLSRLSTHLCRLKTLNLDLIAMDSDTFIALIPENIQTLTLNSLYVSEWEKVINKPLPQLQKLELSGLSLSTETLKTWLKGLLPYKELCSLTVTGFNGSVDDELSELLDQIPHVSLKFLHKNQAQFKKSSCPHPEKIQKPAPEDAVDSDTTFDPKKSFHFSRIFFSTHGGAHPEVSRYRLNTYNTLRISRTEKPFQLNNTLSEDWDRERVKTIIRTAEDVFAQSSKIRSNCYYGKQKFSLSAEWQPIPSLSPNEKISYFHIEPQTAQVELNYSKRDNQYYIRSGGSPCVISMDFLVEEEPYSQPSLSPKIQAIVDEFLNYKQEPLHLTESNPSGEALLDAILHQKTGACRHRAIAFKAMMDKRHIPARVVRNDCHMFVEIFENEHWIRCELGGYPATLNVNESNDPRRQDAPKVSQMDLNYISDGELTLRQQFETWNVEKKQESLLQFIQKLLNGENPKQLVHIDVKKLNLLGLEIQAEAIKTHHPVFYVNSPDDLVCSAPVLKRNNDGSGTWQNQGGALYDFLTRDRLKDTPVPVLIIDYSKFTADDIARISNSLYDQNGRADGTPLPQKTIIVGLIDPASPNSYNGADFYSRFDKIVAPSNFEIATRDRNRFPPLPNGASTERYQINLSHSPAWQTKLLGGWVIQNGKPYFVMGELQAACDSMLPIEMINPPEDDPIFDQMWAQASLTHAIHTHDVSIELPNRGIYFSHGYHWDDIFIEYQTQPSSKAFVFNPTQVHRFISDYAFVDGFLTKTKGLVEQHANQSLELYVTRTLSEDAWDELFWSCKKNNVSLKISCASDVLMPGKRQPPKTFAYERSNWTGELELPETACIITEDADFTVDLILKKQQAGASSPWHVLDVSECLKADLLERIEGGLRGESFDFQLKKQALLTLLEHNQKVILTGNYSNELIDELIPFLLGRYQSKSTSGQLVLLTKNPISALPMLIHNVTVEDKLEALKQHGLNVNALRDESPNALETLPYIELITRLKYKRRNPSNSSNDAFKGLEKLPSIVELDDFNPKNSVVDAIRFVEKRKKLINEALQQEPYVFLAGLTGVGKSRFIENEMNKDGRQLFHGEHLDHIRAWAEARSDHELVLFFDEANLSSRQWSEFESLFHYPPSIVIDGTFYELSPQHKVIFAGNPLSYGDNRQIATLFQRHGNTVVFEPLSCAFIHEAVIKPIFKTVRLDDKKIDAIGEEFFKVYQYLIRCSTDEVLMSPRQLQMIALLIMDYAHQVPDASEEELAQITRYHAVQIARPLVPKQYLHDFDKAFPFQSRPKNDPRVARVKAGSSRSYLHTPSRAAVIHQLMDFLSLRECRRYDGLNRLVLEGEAGIGKTELIIELLVQQGFKEIDIEHLHNMTVHQNNVFYRMPASMNTTQKEKVLLEAFEQGVIVVVDEINSVGMMEKLLNSLLDGKHPGTNKSPTHPGFRLIGTQNPPAYSGRIIESAALANRTQHLRLALYPTEEMIEILCHMGLEQHVSRDMVRAFEFKQDEARLKHLSPAPSFRDLMKCAKQHLKANAMSIKSVEVECSQIQLSARHDTEQFNLKKPRHDQVRFFKSTDGVALMNSIQKIANQMTNSSTLSEEKLQDNLKEVDMIVNQLKQHKSRAGSDLSQSVLTDIEALLESIQTKINILEDITLNSRRKLLGKLADIREEIAEIHKSKNVGYFDLN